jgi:hypothetical protein
VEDDMWLFVGSWTFASVFSYLGRT